jgi:excinuclease ABC subunit A
LLEVLQRLFDQGSSVVACPRAGWDDRAQPVAFPAGPQAWRSHNAGVIKVADWIIDLGPEGGVRGGEVIAEGTPEQVAKVKRSFTGSYLAPLLDRQLQPAPA